MGPKGDQKMDKRTRRTATAILLAALVVGAAAAPAVAGPEVEGIVTSVSGSTVSLLGGAVKIGATGAKILRRGTLAVLGIADIFPGVEIDALVSPAGPDGVLPASEILVGKQESVEIRSAVDKVDAATETLTVSGIAIRTDDKTLFSGRSTRGPVAAFSDLAAGDFVEVEALPTASGLVASSVHVETDPKPSPGMEFEFEGTVEAISAGSWTISGKTILVTSKTVIKGGPKVGDKVDVEGTKAADGTLTADRITLESSPPSAQNFEFEGTVEAISATSWTISGKTILVTSKTVIKGEPKVGDKVDVEGTKAADGTLTASRITKTRGGSSKGGDD
jgi:hypothetical protein